MNAAIALALVGAVLLTTASGEAHPLARQLADTGLHIVIPDTQQTLFLHKTGERAVVTIDGRGSHTHESGARIVAHAWTNVATGAVIGRSALLSTLAFLDGEQSVQYTITDNFGASLSLPLPFKFTVAPYSSAPGALVRIYLSKNPAKVTGRAVFGVVTPLAQAFSVKTEDLPATLRQFTLRMQGSVLFPADAVVGFTGINPGTALPWLAVDGVQYVEGTSPKISSGKHFIEFRCYLARPASVAVTLNGLPIVNPRVDLTQIPPIVNSISSGVNVRKGEPAEVQGLLLKGVKMFLLSDTTQSPAQQIVAGAGSLATDALLTFVWPIAPLGKNFFYVTNALGRSNSIAVKYNATVEVGYGGPFSDTILFKQKKSLVAPPSAKTWVTRMVFCHGSIFASHRRDNLPGEIVRIEVDDQYNITSKTVLVTVPTMDVILGLACDPRDSDADFKLYFSHSRLYAQNGNAPPTNQVYPYLGAVSYIMPNKAGTKTIVPLIRNLGVSNHDHGINGLAFDHRGRLLICSGSNTNAGIKHIGLGLLDEGPTTGVILAADIRHPSFNGNVVYEFLPDAPAAVKLKSPQDQLYTGWVRSTNPYIKPFAYGARNAFAVYVDLLGRVKLTVNGPNTNYGEAMTGLDPDTKQPIATADGGPQTADGVWLDLQEGSYLGHPNLAFCRAGHMPSCTYVRMTSTTAPLGSNFSIPNTILGPSATGLLEYRSHAFGGVYNGQIFIAGYVQSSWRYDPVTKVKQNSVASSNTYPKSHGIDFFHVPGGVHMLAQYDDQVSSEQTSNYVFNYPHDEVVVASGNPSVYDIVPEKASQQQSGRNTFVIGGENFQNLPLDVLVAAVPALNRAVLATAKFCALNWTAPSVDYHKELCNYPVSRAFNVTFGGAPATDLQVVGTHWIKGTIPTNLAGACPTSVEVRFALTTLRLVNSFCYLGNLPAMHAPPYV